MSSTSSRIPLLLALLFSIFVVAIGVWTDNALFVAPFWLLQLLLLGLALWGQAHELRNLRQVQARLAAREQQYRLLSEGATEGVWAVDLDGAVTYMSPSVVHLRGYSREESLAMTWEQRVAAGMNPLLVQQLHAALARLRAGEKIGEQVTVATHTHRLGHPVWLETTLAPLWGDGGEPLGLRLVSRDVTAREEARLALQRSEERFAQIFHASPAAIVLTRADDGALLDVNVAFEHISGYSRAEALGRTGPDLGILTPAAGAVLAARVAAEGCARGIDLQVTTATGAVLDVLYTIVPVVVDGEPALLSIIFDITERRRIEHELRILNLELEGRVALRTADLQTALAELQTALALKSEFLALVSHELRTPLTGVLAMAELLDSEVGGPLSSRQRTYLAGVQSGSRRLLDLVNNILSYTQLLSGSVELQHEPCRIDYLLDLAAAALRPQAARKQQTLTTTITPAALTVMGDPIVLVQIVKRLLDNAVKFTPAGGAVGAEARLHPMPPSYAASPGSAGCADASLLVASSPLVTAGGAPDAPGAFLEIVVWDTGIGLALADLPNVVKPFVQGESGLARSHEGTGMGLAYVDRMLAYLGGGLTLEPNPGGGSRFIATLPVALP